MFAILIDLTIPLKFDILRIKYKLGKIGKIIEVDIEFSNLQMARLIILLRFGC
jgi:hypothetical protein